MRELAHLYYVFEIGSLDHLEGEFRSKWYTGKMKIEKTPKNDRSEKAPTHLIFGYLKSGERKLIGVARLKIVKTGPHRGDDFLHCRLNHGGAKSYPFSVFQGNAHAVALSWPPRVWENVLLGETTKDKEEENSK